ncbi:MAG: polysaccharide biosynthesis tyrosine autokinase [Muribaculaceae bacterium]|nr:polysaccharide biosynthesis tyrosine autokinase [Muribaculaceae bacterium]
MNEIDEKEKKSGGEDSFDIVGLLLEYLVQWKWFALSIFVALIVGYYWIATITPIYEVSASIYLKDDSFSSNKSSAVAISSNDPLINTKNYIDVTEIEILKSRNNLIKIVDSLDLSYSYYDVKRFRDDPIYGTNAVIACLDSISLRNLTSPITVYLSRDDGTYAFDISTTYGGVKESKTIKTDTLPVNIELSQGTLQLLPSHATSHLDGTQKIVIENPNVVAARLSANLNIVFAKNSSEILRIVCRTPLVSEGKDVINTLIEIYNQDIIADKNRSAMQTEAFIIDRLALISGELHDVEKEVEDYRREKNITDISAETGMYLSQTTANDAAFADLEVKRQLINDVEKIVTTQDNYTPIPNLIDDPSLNALIDAYNKKLSQRAALLEGGTEDNPIIQNMQEDLARSKNDIYRSISNVKHGLGIQKSNLSRQDTRITGKISNIPMYERELTGIFREQRVKDNIYNFLLEKREEIALQKTLATPTARLIDNPSSGEAISPGRLSIYGIAALVGFLIPALLIFLKRVFFPIFKDKDDLERVTKTPILGEISIAENNEQFAISENAITPISELFRLIRNNIQFALADNEKKVIVVSSSLSGEGKTFIAVNTAMTYALTGKKTLVIGMDIRRPVLAHRFGFSNERGVTTFLSGQEKNIMSLVLQSKVNDNLYVLPGGPVPPNPNELLLSAHMKQMFDKLRQEFDYVIIDTAPIGVVSDTYLIAPYSDIQLYVTRANYSTKRCLNIMHNAIDSKRFPNCYLVLNGVNIKSNSYVYRRYGTYGKYGSYGYKGTYGYGYGYTETPSDVSVLKRLWKKKTKKK